MAGTLSLALAQQVNIDGTPLAGCLLYFFAVGTVATPQNSYQDYGLTLVNSNPLEADQYGRIPMFYLADGSVHVRLTDANGVVILDYPAMEVIGSSSNTVTTPPIDPTTIFGSGDFKWRPTAETLTGWVKANGTSIGGASSGATQRANADTQNLFVYLWNNFTNAHCPVAGGRGASGLVDFAASRTITLPDLRGRTPIGLDNMGSSAAGRLNATYNKIVAPDGVTTAAAVGGEGWHVLTLAEAPVGQFTFNDAYHNHTVGIQALPAATGPDVPVGMMIQGGTLATTSSLTGASISDHAGGQPHDNLPPVMLGSYYIKL